MRLFGKDAQNTIYITSDKDTGQPINVAMQKADPANYIDHLNALLRIVKGAGRVGYEVIGIDWASEVQ